MDGKRLTEMSSQATRLLPTVVFVIAVIVVLLSVFLLKEQGPLGAFEPGVPGDDEYLALDPAFRETRK